MGLSRKKDQYLSRMEQQTRQRDDAPGIRAFKPLTSKLIPAETERRMAEYRDIKSLFQEGK